MIDYLLLVKSATGEDVLTPHSSWFAQILRGEKQALFPNHFMIDPTGDWGGFQGAIISRGLPARLAFVLAGTPDGPGAQHLVQAGIALLHGVRARLPASGDQPRRHQRGHPVLHHAKRLDRERDLGLGPDGVPVVG